MNTCSKKININLRYFDVVDQAQLFYKLMYANLAAVQACHGYIELYAPKVGRTPTLVHELEHVRRNSYHQAKDAHSDGINKDGELASFDACANSFANDKIQQGFLLSWARHVQKKCPQKTNAYELVAAIRDNEHILRDVIAADKEWFIRMLGY